MAHMQVISAINNASSMAALEPPKTEALLAVVRAWVARIDIDGNVNLERIQLTGELSRVR